MALDEEEILEFEKGLESNNYLNTLARTIDKYLITMGSVTAYLEGGAINDKTALLELRKLFNELRYRIQFEFEQREMEFYVWKERGYIFYKGDKE